MVSGAQRDQVETKFALGVDGRLIHIDAVDPDDRYARAPYSCVGCGHKMVPAKGKVRAHHFKHYAERPVNCTDETYLHVLAKTTLFEAITDAIALGSPYHFRHERELICERYLNDLGYVCRDATVVEDWDVTRSFDRVALETAHAGFVPDVLLSSSKHDKVIFLEIKVSHGCEDEKIASGIRIIEIEVENEEDALSLRDGISLLDPSVVTYGLRQVAPKTGRCREHCNAVGAAFAVFSSSKTLLKIDVLEELLELKAKQTICYFHFLGTRDDVDIHRRVDLYFENTIAARFGKGAEVKSCLLCRNGALGRSEKPIYCFELRTDAHINDATGCEHYRPVSTAEEARRRYKRSVEYLQQAGGGWTGAVDLPDSVLDLDDIPDD